MAIHPKDMISMPTFSTCTVGRIVLVDWRGQPTKAAVQAIEGLINGLLASEKSIGFLAVTQVDTPAPGQEARDAFAGVMKAHAARIFGSTMTIEGGGLRAAANRAVLTAITLLGDVSPVPKVCSTIEEAAGALVRMSSETAGGASLTVGDIVGAFAEMRGRQSAA